MKLTWFREMMNAQGLRVDLDGDELTHMFANAAVHRGEKHSLPGISTAIFRGDRRANERVIEVSAVGFDLDAPTDNPNAIVALVSESLGGVEVFAHSTFSSEPGAVKLRALVPYDAPATAAQHSASWALAARALAKAGIETDPACKDPARFFFVPAIPLNGAYFWTHVDGDAWPVAYAAEAETQRQAEIEAQRARRRPLVRASGDIALRARRYLAKCEPAISGSHGHDATYAAALKLTRGFDLDVDTVFALMAAEYNPRCKPPWSDRDLRRKVEQAAGADRVGEGWLASGASR